MTTLRSEDRRVYNLRFARNNILSRPRTSQVTISTLRGFQFTYSMAELPQLLEDIGASVYFTHNVMQVSYSEHQDLWTDKNGTVLWPPRTPDLVAVDL